MYLCTSVPLYYCTGYTFGRQQITVPFHLKQRRFPFDTGSPWIRLYGTESWWFDEKSNRIFPSATKPSPSQTVTVTTVPHLLPLLRRTSFLSEDIHTAEYSTRQNVQYLQYLQYLPTDLATSSLYLVEKEPGHTHGHSNPPLASSSPSQSPAFPQVIHPSSLGSCILRWSIRSLLFHAL